MKKILAFLVTLVMIVSLAAGCTPAGTVTPVGPTAAPVATINPTVLADFKVGMVTDVGSIDDKSFNQGTWEGITRASNDLGIVPKYLKPVGQKATDYEREIGNLYSSGFKFIVTPGFYFSQAIYDSQKKYKDANFVLIDAQPADATGKVDFGPNKNTASVQFAEEQSGYLAGIATAVQLKDGKIGFIGGIKIPAVEKYNWGFQQGLVYANDVYQTTVTMEKKDFVYSNTFDNTAITQQLAAKMFTDGVKAIFVAAGGAGAGAINEAKNRAAKGENVWIIGVDIDQYAQGLDDTNTKSVILTSAMKKIDVAAYDMIMAMKNKKFPGGKTITYNILNGGVGVPTTNVNLSADTMAKVAEVTAKYIAKDPTILIQATDPGLL